MWRLVLRVFPLALLSLFAAILVVVNTVYYFMAAPIEEAYVKQAQGPIFAIKHYLASAPSPEVRQQRILTYQKLHEGTFKQVDEAVLTAAQKAQLKRGDIVVAMKVLVFLDLRAQYYFALPDGDVFFITDIINNDHGFDELDTFLWMANLSVLVVFLFFISVWTAFHWSALKKLMRATDRIGKGDFSARAKLNRYASTYMVAYKVNQMASYIERLVNGQRELIHSVSHELRTPIARLNFGLALLDDASPHQRARIKALQSDVDELGSLVNELLQLASVGQQYLSQPQTFALRPSLLACVPELKTVAEHKQVVVDLPLSLGEYQGDAVLLERVWKNLLGNALKYGHGQIRYSARRLKDQSVLVWVEDDGPGIPEAEYERVFEPFYRLDTALGVPTTGYGLGLAIVRKIVSLHHGRISMSRSELGGVKVTVTLPPQAQDGHEA
ncbi:MAG: hypothetical protein KA214_03205 [Neisseriaceae bacterium]|nr:hypothetical protein [Neisseriaceae bacterium]